MKKPTACDGCPLWQDGNGFVPGEYVAGSRVLVLAQNPGADEVEQARPMVGKTGQMMDRSFLPLAGLERGKDVSVDNVIRCRWHGTNDLPTGAVLDEAIAHCTRAHLHIPDHIDTLVAQGSLALRLTSGETHASITTWRGYCLPRPYQGRSVFCVVHLADVFRDPRQFWIAQQDWRRLSTALREEWPLRVPSRLTVTEDNVAEAEQWVQDALTHATHIALDTEYDPDTRYLRIIGIGYTVQPESVYGLQGHVARISPWLRGAWARWMHALLRALPVVVQNYAADIPVLEQAFGITVEQYKQIDDTMLMHSVLWSELPHDLEFLASIYGRYPKLKHLARTDEMLYNWGDVLETLSTYDALQVGFRYDGLARHIYESQSRPLIPHILRASKDGIRVNDARVKTELNALVRRVADVARMADAWVGRPFNLGSGPVLADWLYRVKRYPLQRIGRSSRPRTDDDAIATLRTHVGPPFDPAIPLTMDSALERIAHGADPILELRVLYAEAQHTISSYLVPLVGQTRIYPSQRQDAQRTGRWTVKQPPLAQLPENLRDIIQPDDGDVWIKWDWKAIEPRILCALCGSQVLQDAFDKDLDIHTWTVCTAFGYDLPPNLKDVHDASENAVWRQRYHWRGGNDPRRVFAKQARYEMYYGGTGSNVCKAAARFGLDRATLQAACAKLVTADPHYYAFRQRITAEVHRSRLVRSFMGRPRRFITPGLAGTFPASVVREALDYPMQSAVVDIYNTTILELARQCPWLRYVWGMHDSQYHACCEADATPEHIAQVKAIVQRPHMIEGKMTPFPAEFKLIRPGERERSI